MADSDLVFTTHWSNFGGPLSGIVISGDDRTEYELKEYGSGSASWLSDFFPDPSGPGTWRWDGSVELVRRFDGFGQPDDQVDYTGEWVRVDANDTELGVERQRVLAAVEAEMATMYLPEEVADTMSLILARLETP